MLPINEQNIKYDNSFEEEHYLQLSTGERIALQAITNDIIKRFIKNEAITIDTLHQYPIKWDEIDKIKKTVSIIAFIFKMKMSYGHHSVNICREGKTKKLQTKRLLRV